MNDMYCSPDPGTLCEALTLVGDGSSGKQGKLRMGLEYHNSNTATWKHSTKPSKTVPWIVIGRGLLDLVQWPIKPW